MSQAKFPKPVADIFLKHIDSIRSGSNPDLVVFECIKSGIAAIKSNGRFDNLASKMDIKHISSEKRIIYYAETESVGPIYNDLRIHMDIKSRRNLVRDALIVYMIDNKVLKEADIIVG